MFFASSIYRFGVHRPQRVVMRCGNLPFKEKPAGKHKQRKHPLKVVSQGRLLKFSPKKKKVGKSIQNSLNNLSFFFSLGATLVPFYVTTKPTSSPGSCPRVRLSICSISRLRNLQGRRGSCPGEVRLSCSNVHILSMVCQAERQNRNSLL